LIDKLHTLPGHRQKTLEFFKVLDKVRLLTLVVPKTNDREDAAAPAVLARQDRAANSYPKPPFGLQRGQFGQAASQLQISAETHFSHESAETAAGQLQQQIHTLEAKYEATRRAQQHVSPKEIRHAFEGTETCHHVRLLYLSESFLFNVRTRRN